MAENSDVDKWDEHLEQLIGKSVMSRNLCIARMYVCVCVVYASHFLYYH